MPSPDRNIPRVSTFMRDILRCNDSSNESLSKFSSGIRNPIKPGYGKSGDRQFVAGPTALDLAASVSVLASFLQSYS